ncbi:MAG: stage III sporulation protein AE [Lachnospiraceae bacterium]|nr:stage III sporulation protein AE [Lachnospiraceae bacterium]MBQ7780679.1 stage III sporulation protein AE [Lachnospiraceae bacterium]
MSMELSEVWEKYGMGDLEAGLAGIFPDTDFSLSEMFSLILSGDVWGGISYAVQTAVNGVISDFSSIKEIFIWIMVLGIAAAVISHFIEIFDNHQIADIGFYFTYLLMSVLLLKCFTETAKVAADTMGDIVNFITAFIPAYFLSVGMATGSVTATAGYQIVLLLIYLVENVLLTLVLPLINSYILLTMINGLWAEERLTLLVEGMDKAIRFLLKMLLGLVTGLSVLQSMITPAIDSVKATALQKAVAAIPGVGNAADGVVDIMLGSAVLIKNSIGIVLLLLLLAFAAAPLLKILVVAFLLKAAAAFLGMVSDKRITTCTDRVGNGGQLLFKTVGTSVLLFLITISVASYTTNRGF